MDEQDDRGGAVFKIKSPFFNGLSHLVGPCWINFLRWGMGKMVAVQGLEPRTQGL